MANETPFPAAAPAPAAPKVKEPAVGFAEVGREVNNIERAVKVLEDRIYNIRQKEKIDSENMLETNKRVFSDLRAISSDVMEVKREIEDLKIKLRLIVQEIKLSAKDEDVARIKKYLDLWEPLNFVTRSEAEKIIKSIIDDELREKGL